MCTVIYKLFSPATRIIQRVQVTEHQSVGVRTHIRVIFIVFSFIVRPMIHCRQRGFLFFLRVRKLVVIVINLYRYYTNI